MSYRPPPFAKNNQCNGRFLKEIDELLHHLFLASKAPAIVVGDFNVHMDDERDPLTRKFSELLEAVDVLQFVADPTHDGGHILDLVIGKSDFIANISVVNPLLSDHRAIMFSVEKFPLISTKVKTEIKSRSFRSINIEQFSADITESLASVPIGQDVDKLWNAFDKMLTQVVNKHAPVIVTQRRNVSRSAWITPVILKERQQRRVLERQWRERRDDNSRSLYTDKRNLVNKLIMDAKRAYYSQRIVNASNRQKVLFKVFSELSGKNTHILPNRSSDLELAEAFSSFFYSKIETIHRQFPDESECGLCLDLREHVQPVEKLNQFSTVSIDEVVSIINQSNCSSCHLDTLPAWLWKKFNVTLSASIATIMSCSIATSTVPVLFKTAIIRPLFKKPSLNPEDFSSYRPVSNLPFLSKVLERCVLNQIRTHLNRNQLYMYDKFQSAYREYHSTEALLVRLHDEVLSCLDREEIVFLVLLDLSAAIDTLSHRIILQGLEEYAGITESALSWLASYISDRSQSVQVGSVFSKGRCLK